MAGELGLRRGQQRFVSPPVQTIVVLYFAEEIKFRLRILYTLLCENGLEPGCVC